MIIVDKALSQRAEAGNPIRVGMYGAGYMGRGVALQIATATPGMELVAICNRDVEKARRAFDEAGQGEDVAEVTSPAELDRVISLGKRAITNDPDLLVADPQIEVILEVTGSIEYGAYVVVKAIENGKHVVLLNAELDGTVGPILKRRADSAGVIFTNIDGDQPGVMMNLYRFVRGIGVRPVMCGNIKGLQDPYRNPETQVEYAKRWGQKPAMVASFADGTKISFEQAAIANGCDMRVLQRAMMGPTVEAGTAIEEAVKLFPAERLLEGPGWVDYVVGAAPAPGVFVLGTIEHPRQRHYLELYKMGKGPLYCFHTPFHLCHFEVPNTIARAALFHDAALAPQAGPKVDVVAAAKTDLKAGAVIDGFGGFMTYGIAENADVVAAEGLLPIGLALGCTLKCDVAKDAALRLSDVMVPAGRLIDSLRAEQNDVFCLNPRVAPATAI